MNIDYVDITTLAGNAYEYMIRAVDSERNPIPTNPDVSVGYATNGETLIGHGTIVTFNLCGYPVDGYVHESYPQECLPFIDMGRSAVLEPYVNTGQPLRLYGQISTGWNCEGSFATQGVIARVEPSRCLTAVESTTWGEMKHLYR